MYEIHKAVITCTIKLLPSLSYISLSMMRLQCARKERTKAKGARVTMALYLGRDSSPTQEGQKLLSLLAGTGSRGPGAKQAPRA
jgi:hypothetical protein